MTSLILAVLFAAEPKPLPGVVPAATFARRDTKEVPKGQGYSWGRNPLRETRHWRGVGGLLFCDDPDCLWCADAVYGFDRWPVPPVEIRR